MDYNNFNNNYDFYSSNSNNRHNKVARFAGVLLVVLIVFVLLVTFNVIDNPISKFFSDTESIQFANSKYEMRKDESIQLEIKGNSKNELRYESSDGNIISVDEATGFVTANDYGVATIYVISTSAKTKNAIMDECKITVVKPVSGVKVTDISLSSNNLTLQIGEVKQLTYKVMPTNAENVNIYWSNSNSDVVTIDNNGNVEGAGLGTSTISVRTEDGLEATCLVTVVEKTSPTSNQSSSDSTPTNPTNPDTTPTNPTTPDPIPTNPTTPDPTPTNPTTPDPHPTNPTTPNPTPTNPTTPSESNTPKVSITTTNDVCQVVLNANVDNSIKLASDPYSWDNKNTWTKNSTYTVTKKGTYRLYVKDINGKIYSEEYTVNDLNVPTQLKNGLISSQEFNLTKGTSNITDRIANINTRNFNKALQCAHNNGITELRVERGQYYFEAHNFNIRIDFSNLTLDLNGSEFYVYPNTSPTYVLINVRNTQEAINNIFIKNGTLIGDRYQHKCASGTWSCTNNGWYRCENDSKPSHEQGHGIAFTGSINATVYKMTIKDMMGDGIYINDGANPNENGITIYNNDISNCRRNGISLIGGKNIVIRRNTIHDINGTSPEVAIDIERNSDKQFYENVIIDSNTIYGSYRRYSIVVHDGVKGYLKISNNTLGDPVTINKINEKLIVIKNNTAYTANNCICDPNSPIYVWGSTSNGTHQEENSCSKCQPIRCTGVVRNGAVQK